jgi:hypothetical protein
MTECILENDAGEANCRESCTYSWRRGLNRLKGSCDNCANRGGVVKGATPWYVAGG